MCPLGGVHVHSKHKTRRTFLISAKKYFFCARLATLDGARRKLRCAWLSREPACCWFRKPIVYPVAHQQGVEVEVAVLHMDLDPPILHTTRY